MPHPHSRINTAPLAGHKILVTRAAHQAASLTQKLESLGAKVIELPLIEILPPVSWSDFDNTFAKAENYNWLLFASVNAVEFTADRLQQTGLLACVASRLSVATVGEFTARAATAAGFTVVFHPAQFTASAVAQQFSPYLNAADKLGDASDIKMIWPRTDAGPKDAADELRKAGARIDTVICYRTALPKNSNEISKKLAAMLLDKAIDVITLNSAQTARNFFELLKLGLDSPGDFKILPETLLAPITIASIGPETSAAAKQLFGRVDIEATTHSIDGLVEELTSCLG